MSYSFTVRAANKAAVKLAVAAKFEEAAKAQTCHERDKAQALAAADAFVDLLEVDDNKDVQVVMSGSLTGHWTATDVTSIQGASVSVSAYLMTREVAAA